MTLERMFKVEIAHSAEVDLQRAWLWYFEKSSQAVAERWKAEILNKAESLSVMPRRCAFAVEHFYHELELRHIRAFSHLLIFTIKDNRVVVVRIRHGRQNPKQLDENIVD